MFHLSSVTMAVKGGRVTQIVRVGLVASLVFETPPPPPARSDWAQVHGLRPVQSGTIQIVGGVSLEGEASSGRHGPLTAGLAPSGLGTVIYARWSVGMF